jgi:hypothetical protein
LELVAYNFYETSSTSINNWNEAPGAKEARHLLMPPGDQDVIATASQQLLMCPETNWETYVAAQKDAEEECRRAVAARKEEYMRDSQMLYTSRDYVGNERL